LQEQPTCKQCNMVHRGEGKGKGKGKGKIHPRTGHEGPEGE